MKFLLQPRWMSLVLCAVTGLSLTQEISFADHFKTASIKDSSRSDVAKGASAQKCTDQIKSCYAQAEPKRSDCLYNTAKADECTQSPELAQLSFKRWSMSAGQPSAEDAPPNLLGPKLINRACVDSFDSQWSSALIEGEVNPRAIQQLSERLDTCVQRLPIDINRP